ncbi:MAG: hypothetical protein AB7N76_09630 [Planctomycetota bacterium]
MAPEVARDLLNHGSVVVTLEPCRRWGVAHELPAAAAAIRAQLPPMPHEAPDPAPPELRLLEGQGEAGGAAARRRGPGDPGLSAGGGSM